jgi:phage-related protein
LADRHAALPFDGKPQGIVGSANKPAKQEDRRVLFCAHEAEMILLHGFIKKTQKTPKADLDLAMKRMRGLT